MFALWFILGIVAAFLVGSVPNGVIVGKIFGIDIRKHGSGNIGTTNALRQMGWGPGLAVGALDITKGVLGCALMLIFMYFGAQVGEGVAFDWAMGLALLSCSCGHMYSPWLKFKGGKGIATSFGGFIISCPWCAVTSLAAFVLLVAITRRVSIGSLAGAVGYLLGAIFIYMSRWPLVVVAVILTALVFWAHRSNIVRIYRGEESAFKAGSKQSMQQAREEEKAAKIAKDTEQGQSEQ